MQNEEQNAVLSQWLSRHRGLLFKVARSFTNDGHDRDDLIQEIAFRLWHSVPTYPRGKVAESTWIYRVSLYTAINWSQKERTRTKRTQDFGELPETVYCTEEDNPRVDWLYKQIAELDPLDRSLTLMLLDGLTYQQMSEALGMSESNVGVRINRIKKKLSKKLAEENSHDVR